MHGLCMLCVFALYFRKLSYCIKLTKNNKNCKQPREKYIWYLKSVEKIYFCKQFAAENVFLHKISTLKNPKISTAHQLEKNNVLISCSFVYNRCFHNLTLSQGNAYVLWHCVKQSAIFVVDVYNSIFFLLNHSFRI